MFGGIRLRSNALERQVVSQKIIAVKSNSAVSLDDELIFLNPYSGSFDEVPGGAPHGHGFTINGVFHRVHEGQDITELVERAYASASEVNTVRLRGDQ
jgi:hypothetical protein